ncbi:hypothetical protein FF1_028196 [Malus domestica]
MSGLFQRRSCASPLCPLCLEFKESVEHSILLCPWTKAVWFATPLNYQIDIQAITNFDQWFVGRASLREGNTLN